MPLRPLPYRELRRRLEAAGFSEVGQSGSHVKFVNYSDDGTYTAIVPRHREVAVGTIRSILRQASITVEEFDAL